MDIVRFDPYKHARHLSSWLESRNLPVEGSTNLPDLGLILFDTNCPVVAGFLRRVEGGYAILDSLITNPDVPPSIRDNSLDLLVKQLIELARNEGIVAIQATTLDPNTLSRSLKHGFQIKKHTLITLKI